MLALESEGIFVIRQSGVDRLNRDTQVINFLYHNISKELGFGLFFKVGQQFFGRDGGREATGEHALLEEGGFGGDLR